MSPRVEKLRTLLSAPDTSGEVIISREFLQSLVEDYDLLSALTTDAIVPVEIYNTHSVWCEVRRILAKYAETDGSRFVQPLVVTQAVLGALDKLIKRRIANRKAP